MSVAIMLTYIYTCNGPGCSVHAQTGYRISVGSRAPHRLLPDNWREIHFLHFCPKHEVNLVVDGTTTKT